MKGVSSRPSLLIISFSPLRSDARVLKQIGLLSADYDITTCGYGPAPDGVVAHVEVPISDDFQDMHWRLLFLRWYRIAYWRISAVRFARRNLARGAFDIVLANETETVPIAFRLVPAERVHVDLHEYTPRLKEEHPGWDKRKRPFYEWLCRRAVAKAGSWTTVGPHIAQEYEKNFGFLPDVVTNAAPLADLSPSPVGERIRLVHGGACLRNRRLDVLLEAVDRASSDVTLDLFLTPNDPGFLDELKERAASMPRVTVHPPLPYPELIPTLNSFDVGVHVLPPTNFNNAWALPNKLFEFAQARLGVVVGPSPEMASYVNRLGFGAVTAGFDADDLTRVLDTLTPEAVVEWKRCADANARELSAETQLPVWKRAIDRIAASQGDRARAVEG